MTNQDGGGGGNGDPSHQNQQQQSSFDNTNTNNNTNNNTNTNNNPPAAVQVQDPDQDVVPEHPTQRTLQLWREVAFGIDKNQTVVWKNAVDSLEEGLQYLRTSNDARTFIETYMKTVISILLEQLPHKIGMMERNCVESSLKLALQIIEDDIQIKVKSDVKKYDHRNRVDVNVNANHHQSQDVDVELDVDQGENVEPQQLEECRVLDVLAMMFDRKKQYYKGTKLSGWNSSMNGLPEIRNNLVLKFRSRRNFGQLALYLDRRAGSDGSSGSSGTSSSTSTSRGGTSTSNGRFPSLDIMRQIIIAAADVLPKKKQEFSPVMRNQIENDLIAVCKAVMKHLTSSSEDYLKKQNNHTLTNLRYELQNVFDPLFESRREETFLYYAFCRDFAYKLITSQSLPLKLYGWDTIADLIDAAQEVYRPPPKCFAVLGAGTGFVNGLYTFAANLTSDGYVVPRSEIRYECSVPIATKKDADGKVKKKKITLFRCTMRSQQKWWFLSEADEHQPGTDKDIDFYQHKSKKDEEDEPPTHGWTTCGDGVDPSPVLEAKGIMVPPGEEYNTMEHQLAKWAISNGIVERVLGNSIHREIVARSQPLIKFLASMCTKDDLIEVEHENNSDNSNVGPNAFCLQESHLTLAWNTCKSKLDPAVSAEVYQLLAFILPELSNSLAIELLTTVQQSLSSSGGTSPSSSSSNNESDNLFEVAEFCSILAGGNSEGSNNNNNSNSVGYIRLEVRVVLLKLFWAVLTHPEAHTLKCYQILKSHVTHELRVEPMGTKQRELFLNFCKQSLSSNSAKSQADESAVLRMVNLTQFILEACPQEQSTQLVFENSGELAKLIFNELLSYLNRRLTRDVPLRKTASNLLNSPVEFHHSTALTERLNIIRYVYGISGTVEMTSKQLDSLWQICDSAEDREAIMVFLANASSSEAPYGGASLLKNPSYKPLTSSFSHEVRLYAFQSLFCSSEVDWERLGFKAYKSFQILFKLLRGLTQSFLHVQEPALNALWRICLQAGNDDVASQAMRDLLHIYSSMSVAKREKEAATSNAWAQKPSEEIPFDSIEAFSTKIYACLDQVRYGLKKGDKLSERSAERCVRILNAAIGHAAGCGGKGISASSVHFKPASFKGLVHKMSDIVKVFPHGLRGQSCYRTVSVLAKRAGGGRRLPQTERFFLRVHPLESLSSINRKVSICCNHEAKLVKPISHNNNRTNLNSEPDSAIVSDVGIVEGSEIVFLLCHNALNQSQMNKNGRSNDKSSGLSMSDIFGGNGQGLSDEFFETLLDVLEALPVRDEKSSTEKVDTQILVWDLLQSVPTNEGLIEKVRSVSQCPFADVSDEERSQEQKQQESMVIDIKRNDMQWAKLLDLSHYQKAVYILQAIDAFLQPSTELLEQVDKKKRLAPTLSKDAALFRQAFIDSGGFDAVRVFFNRQRAFGHRTNHIFRRENVYIFRIIRCCLFGRIESSSIENEKTLRPPNLDNLGSTLLKSLNKEKSFFTNLAGAVVMDSGISDNVVIDVLFILKSCFMSDDGSAAVFASVPDDLAEKLIISILMWESNGGVNAVTIGAGRQIRKTTEDLILSTPVLSAHSLPWLIKALDNIDNNADTSEEYFSVLIRLVELSTNSDQRSVKVSHSQLSVLATALCKKLAHCPRPDIASADYSTGVLCGCLRLLKALIHIKAILTLSDGVMILVNSMNTISWVPKGSLQCQNDEDSIIINLIGVIFDAFLSDDNSSSATALCSDNKSRRTGFDVLFACANACHGGKGYIALSSKIRSIIKSSSPYLRHRWGQNLVSDDIGTLNVSSSNAQYSGLRNQGCTCYMNSVLQQLFMMPELRANLSSATLPSGLRSTGGALMTKGTDLIGKCLSIHWENGICYDAIVQAYNSETTMHTIQYVVPKVQSASNVPEHRLQNADDFSNIPDDLPDEFILSEGRPGKETGVFEIIQLNKDENLQSGMHQNLSSGESSGEKNTVVSNEVKETDDEISYRRLLEEVQRTFVHLDKGSRGRVFDPRSLVEASGCLKLEFDIWQQNDASEFAMKLLDKLEVPLKRWSPNHFKYLEHTFRLKQTKQKLCKECGLKTNREENLMNIDCQIRGKSDIHEALSTMCEVEYMEGDNKVFCDNCKKNCDTVLRTAISALPDMLILSLKRFDLDYTTFETVKLNSRCAFEQSLNMKKYTLEGVEAMEKASAMSEDDNNDSDEMYVDPLSVLPDADYEYRLAGVLVHHGVAQGGHYYSFIRDRTGSNVAQADKWFRFDDDEVSPFDPSQIEVECFGGKVKKETKWPNGSVNTVETEQLANALMLFYEKVKPTKFDPSESENDTEMDDSEGISNNQIMATGFEVFEGDVKRSNSVHRSHAFLFDAEFQRFVRRMSDVGLTSDSYNAKNSVLSSPSESSVESYSSFPWHVPILELSISCFFDVLLHSPDKVDLNDWSKILSSALASSMEGSTWVVHELARRTKTINNNWLRIFSSDCPEKVSRQAAMQVIASSMRGCLRQSKERTVLKSWTQAWLQQLNVDESMKQSPLPVSLEGQWQSLEDIRRIDTFEASALGTIISYLCSLLELGPRTWQYNAELCLLLKEIASTPQEDGGGLIREALVAAQVPARLIALLLRDKAPSKLQSAMPGTSLSFEMCEAIARPITSSTAHVFPIGNSVGPTTGVGTSNTSIGAPSPSDHSNTLEALALIIGINGAKSVKLVAEAGEIKGRPVYNLTEKAMKALGIVFNECSSRTGFMDQNDIMTYMKLCGLDTSAVPSVSQQRINGILGKYGNESKLLSMDGFLSYYRDTSQTNSLQLRSDLNTFGFRPDLSRCSEDARMFNNSEGNAQHSRIEAVVFDVFSTVKAKCAVGPFLELGLSSLHFYHMAYFTDCHLTEYLLTWSTIHQDTNQLLIETLKSLYQAQSWGNETIQICVMVLMVLAALPDDRQNERISTIMQSPEKLHVRGEVGSGLLNVAKELSLAQSAQQYSADYHNQRSMLDRYIDAIKELRKVRALEKWMSENKSSWEWIDQFLRSDSSSNQGRGDYLNRRDRGGVHASGTLYDNNNSDSDLNGELNESEESDCYGGNTDGYSGGIAIVSGAGLREINGTYTSHKKFDNVATFTKNCSWKGQEQLFTLFRCMLSNQTKRWYISIIPPNQPPGTNKDVDFYMCPATGNVNEVPHGFTWSTVKDMGMDPAPTVEWKNESSSMSDDHDDNLTDQRATSNDEYDDIVDDSNYNDALMEDDTQP